MPRPLTATVLALGLVLAGCATPAVIRKGPSAPTMIRPDGPTPRPAFAAPDPTPHAEPRPDQAAPPSGTGPS
jgi:hypothetical protein